MILYKYILVSAQTFKTTCLNPLVGWIKTVSTKYKKKKVLKMISTKASVDLCQVGLILQLQPQFRIHLNVFFRIDEGHG